jgi:uncharacterized protein YndB with AHSA1/START domain
MTLQAIHKPIEIQAPAEKVWQALLDENHIREWYKSFGEGVEAETDWQLGSKAVFKDQKGNGIIGRIVQRIPNKAITIEYDGFRVDGQPDFESEGAKAAKGSQERYTLQPTANGTMLVVDCEMDESYIDMMSAAWDKALEKIKQISEAL